MIGAINDPLEREADAAANRVMETSGLQTLLSDSSELGRKPTACRAPEGAGQVPPSVYQVLRTPGQPLDAATRNYFEPRFGRDFANIRIHADAVAQRSACEVNARAYTVGRDVVFGPGEFALATATGRHLLAHELAHVVQQDGAATLRLMRAPKSTAQFGDIKPHKEQGKARWSGTIRLSEHEHIRARINLWLQTFDPQTGTSPYSNAAYKRSSTITIPKDMADIKTRMDMQIRDRLRAAQSSGVVSGALVNELTIEADIERTIRARDQAIQARRRAGLSTTDFDNITTDNITRAAHYQQGELFDVGKAQRSPIVGATDIEIESALGPLSANPVTDVHSETDVPSGPDTPKPLDTPKINEVDVGDTAAVETASAEAPAVAQADPPVQAHPKAAHPTVDAPHAPTGNGGSVQNAVAPEEIHKPKRRRSVPSGGSSAKPTTRQQALGAAEKTANVAALVAAGGDIIKQLYEGDYKGAAKTAGITGGALVLGEAAGPLALAYATIQGYDEEVKRDANRAGSRVEKALGEGSTAGRYLGAATAATVAVNEAAYKGIKAPWEAQYTEDVKKRSTGVGKSVENFVGEGSYAGRVAGALATSATATGEVAFRGTFGVVGTSIGEGLAAGYLWIAGDDDEYEVPAYYEQWSANRGKFKRARAHLSQLIAAQPDTPAAAAAAQLLKQIAELEAMNSANKARKTWTYWVSTQASVLEHAAFALHN